MSEAKLSVIGLAGRYATAVFDLAKEAKAIDQVADSFGKLSQALTEVAELKALVASPMISRAQGARAIAAVAAGLGLDPLTTRFLGVLATNRRLGETANAIRGFFQLLAAHRGETAAEVTSAHPLTEAQAEALRAKLRTGLGRDVTLTSRVDPSILGGLVVRVGSKLIDSSLKTKLDSLALAMTKSA